MKRYLIAGLLVWVPLGITIWVLHFLVTTLDQTLLLLPEARAAATRCSASTFPGLGVVLAFLILLVTGVIAANFFGARLIRVWEVGARPHPVRQVDLLVGQAGQRHAAVGQGQRVSQGAAGRVPARGQLDDRVPDRHARAARSRRHLPEEHVSVYVPTTPNPTGGYFLMLPRSQVRELDMTVDEALKYIISMGVVAPRGIARAAARAAPARPTAAPRDAGRRFPKLTGPA